MENLSFSRIIALCLLTLNSVSTHIFIILEKVRDKKNLLILNEINSNKNTKSQMNTILDKGMIRVAICDNFAYWTLDNEIFKAKVNKDGKIDSEHAKAIDVFDLSEKDVTKLLAILDTIKD